MTTPSSPWDDLLLGIQRIRHIQDELKGLRRPAPSGQAVAPVVPPPIEVPQKTSPPLPSPKALLEQLLPAREALLQSELLLREDLVMAQISSPTVVLGASREMEAQVTDLWDRPVSFAHISITQVEIAAPQLAAADSVRLRIYRYGTRREPADLVAEFNGASQVTDMWYASFSNRRIEYSGLGRPSKLYLNVRNTAGNSAATTFQVSIYGRRFPLIAP